MSRNRNWPSVILVLAFCSTLAAQSGPRVEFISLEAAHDVLVGMHDLLPGDLGPVEALDSAKWSVWVQNRDREIRNRLDRGTEDTLTNLLRFGVTFTKEYRIDDEYLIHYGESSLVNAFANRRVDDLIRAFSTPNPPEGVADMRAFVEKKGFSFKTAQERARLKEYLLANLARVRDDFLKYRSQPKDEGRFRLFQDRGISLDTNLWPDYLLDVTFQKMMDKGLLKPGIVRRVAIVGPGLDFANKEAGNDFYPPQTIQPFAVLDSLLKLGLADSANTEVYTFDISPDVNLHIERWRKKAASGQPYVVQLPWNTARPMSEDYQAKFVAYWKKLGSRIGEPQDPIPVPPLAGSTKTRAVRIRPAVVRKITPLDLNVVYQQLEPSPEFDIVIGTNIFLYYGAFEQGLARRNISAMLRPGGYLLSNDKLSDTVASDLSDVLETTTTMSVDPPVTDLMICYRRAN
jgi:hypothetical protein